MAKIHKQEPRMTSFKSENFIRPFKEKSKHIKSIYLERINLDEECKKDIKSNKGFYITNEEDFDKKKGTRTIDGLYSPLFGIDTFTDKVTDECFHCECGKLVGGINEGEICPECGTPVIFMDADLSITGYIRLGEFVVINPACYDILEKLIGGKELQRIIKFGNKYNVKGKNVSVTTKASPFNGIGLIEFYKNFDNIIIYYRDKTKRKEEYNAIIESRDAVFTHVIPVYSALLRPLVKNGSKISMFEVNRSYSIILANANNIVSNENSSVDKTMVIEKALFEIQTEFNKISTDTCDNVLSGKKGLFRGFNTAPRVDYSARMVIVPAKGLSVDQVLLPYAAGVELMRPLIINSLTTIDDINIRTANIIVDNALRKFDNKIWLIMNHIIQKSKNPPRVMVQRSPSLLQESMRFMRIKMVKNDINDLTLGVHQGILDGMNGDFDGDTFSVIMIFDNRLKTVWEQFHSPVNHFISRHDANYSNLSEFINDAAVVLSELWEIGKDSSYYAEWASDTEREKAINSTADC